MHSVKEPLSLSGEGNYALTAVKEIAVTEAFLGLDEKDKKCQSEETPEDCWMKNYLKEGLNNCKCTPYGLRNYSKVEVIKKYINIFVSVHEYPYKNQLLG